MDTDLQQIGARHGTDKADSYHSFSGMSYLDVYDSYFDPLRRSIRCVLELGVYQGRSLKTWRDYFPCADVWGLDIDPTADCIPGSRIHVVIGSQIDPTAIAQLAPGQEFDIVVDDGSHVEDHLITSFELLWPRVKSGGYYVMEDLACSYSTIRPWKDCWPGQTHNVPGTNYDNDRTRINKLFLSKIQQMDGLRGDIRFMHFWPMMCFFKKV